MTPTEFTERLDAHLRSWAGTWPPPAEGVTVVGDPRRLEPTWDGVVRPLQGVGDGRGVVIGVPPAAVDSVVMLLRHGMERPGLGDDLGDVLGVGPAVFGAGVFRTTSEVSPEIEDLGEWFADQTGDLPAWLAPFNGPRLVAFDAERRPLAGVGIKVHDLYGHELSVVTEEAARGMGLGRRLVATAARWVLAHGAVPTYLHDEANVASARVADAVGFRDRGWKVFGLWPTRRTL